MITTKIKLTPRDHGRRMRLADFEPAEWENGHLYELERGAVVVADVPDYPHALYVAAVRDDLAIYKRANPAQIHVILGSMECKLLIGEFESERHPDLSVYKKPPPQREDLWFHWLPDLVIEVVSLSSAQRDYVEKREEYLARGIKEYWIIDGAKQEVLVLKRRGGKWTERVLQPGELFETKLLPGFQFDCAKVFQAAT